MVNEKIISLSLLYVSPFLILIIVTYSPLTLTLIFNLTSLYLNRTLQYRHIPYKSITYNTIRWFSISLFCHQGLRFSLGIYKYLFSTGCAVFSDFASREKVRDQSLEGFGGIFFLGMLHYSVLCVSSSMVFLWCR